MEKPGVQDWAEAEVELQASANAAGCSGVEVSTQGWCPEGGKGTRLLCFYICPSLHAGCPWEAGLIVGKAVLEIFPWPRAMPREGSSCESPGANTAPGE